MAKLRRAESDPFVVYGKDSHFVQRWNESISSLQCSELFSTAAQRADGYHTGIPYRRTKKSAASCAHCRTRRIVYGFVRTTKLGQNSVAQKALQAKSFGGAAAAKNRQKPMFSRTTATSFSRLCMSLWLGVFSLVAGTGFTMLGAPPSRAAIHVHAVLLPCALAGSPHRIGRRLIALARTITLRLILSAQAPKLRRRIRASAWAPLRFTGNARCGGPGAARPARPGGAGCARRPVVSSASRRVPPPPPPLGGHRPSRIFHSSQPGRPSRPPRRLGRGNASLKKESPVFQGGLVCEGLSPGACLFPWGICFFA